MYCPQCGMPITAGALHCPACGKGLEGIEATVASATQPEAVLAGRFERLAAQILNGLLFVPVLAVLFMGGFGGVLDEVLGKHGEPNPLAFFDAPGFKPAVALFLCVLLAQIFFLSTRGQDIGKMALRIRIVKAATGKNGGFVPNFLVRSLINQVIYNFPIIGQLYAVIDILCIFRSDRRCLHDFLAGTRVVKG